MCSWRGAPAGRGMEIRRRLIDLFVTALLVNVLVSAFVSLTREFYMSEEEFLCWAGVTCY